jgi:hypothetical protein
MEQRIIIHAKKSDDIAEGHLGEVVVVFEDTGDSDMISVALGTGPKYYFLPSDLLTAAAAITTRRDRVFLVNSGRDIG